MIDDTPPMEEHPEADEIAAMLDAEAERFREALELEGQDPDGIRFLGEVEDDVVTVVVPRELVIALAADWYDIENGMGPQFDAQHRVSVWGQMLVEGLVNKILP